MAREGARFDEPHGPDHTPMADRRIPGAAQPYAAREARPVQAVVGRHLRIPAHLVFSMNFVSAPATLSCGG